MFSEMPEIYFEELVSCLSGFCWLLWAKLLSCLYSTLCSEELLRVSVLHNRKLLIILGNCWPDTISILYFDRKGTFRSYCWWFYIQENILPGTVSGLLNEHQTTLFQRASGVSWLLISFLLLPSNRFNHSRIESIF